MEEDKKQCCERPKCGCGPAGGLARRATAEGGIYGLAFIGALVYYIQNAGTFMEGVMGFLKALVWPAILIYKLLELLAK